MAAWPENPRLISTRIPRLDGLKKASGAAKYPSDQNPKDLLFGAILYSKHAHAKVKSIDIAPAKAIPGVVAVIAIAKEGTTLRYQGDDIAAVAAESEEIARDALRAIKVDYEVLPHVVTEKQAMADDAPVAFAGGNVRKGRATTRGDVNAVGDVTIEGEYHAPVITHVCLEPHGMTVMWEGKDKIVSWASTQAVQPTANNIAERFQIPISNVTVLTDYMGGGFGSKFGAELWGLTAAELSRQAGGRPVKMFLDRAQEHMAGGNRPSASAKVKLSANNDGKLVSIVAETWGTGGARGGSNFPLPYVYAGIPNQSRTHSEVFVNAGGARAMRAPGHPQGCIIMESAMDDLADKLGIDPVEFRLKNLMDREPVAGGADRSAIYREQVAIGAEMIGWKENRKPRGQNGKGVIKRGLGLALHQWGGGGPPDKQVSCRINPDGSVEVRSATQDLGTGARTILAVITAEVLGLQTTDITSNIGNSGFPPGQPSGGSTTTPAMSPPCYNAALEARDMFFKRIAPSYKCEPGDLSLKDGMLLVKGEAAGSWKDACRKLSLMPVETVGKWSPGLSAVGVGGCQFVDLTVDVETGVVKIKKIVAVQDSGLIIDLLTWESQVYGGIIGGLNYGLFEERVMDPTTGAFLNADMELYKLAGASDIPEIVIKPYDTPAMRARGVIGIGEPPTIATAAAIGNAVTNAIGVRVPNWPMSPMNILNALEGKA